MNRILGAMLGLALAAGLGAGSAQALTTTTAPADCGKNGTSGSATFSITLNVAAQCWTGDKQFGTGKNGELGEAQTLSGLSLEFIDKSDDTGTGSLPTALTPLNSSSLTAGTSGNFSITAPGYTSFMIVFKSGGGQLKPDWAAFLLPVTANVNSISWALGPVGTNGLNSLSHVSLFGLPATSAVPVPAPLALLLAGLGGVGLLARRARKAAPAAA